MHLSMCARVSVWRGGNLCVCVFKCFCLCVFADFYANVYVRIRMLLPV